MSANLAVPDDVEEFAVHAAGQWRRTKVRKLNLKGSLQLEVVPRFRGDGPLVPTGITYMVRVGEFFGSGHRIEFVRGRHYPRVMHIFVCR